MPYPWKFSRPGFIQLGLVKGISALGSGKLEPDGLFSTQTVLWFFQIFFSTHLFTIPTILRCAVLVFSASYI